MSNFTEKIKHIEAMLTDIKTELSNSSSTSVTLTSTYYRSPYK